MPTDAGNHRDAPWAPTPFSTHSAPRKKRRMNYACNYCRSRKTRCDEAQPSCKACENAGVLCVTTNLRKPHARVNRHEAGRRTRPDNRGTVSAAYPSSVASEGDRSTRSEPGQSPTRQSRPELPHSDDVGLERGERHDLSTSHSPPSSPRQTSAVLPVFPQARGSTYSEILWDWVDMALYRLGVHGAWPACMPLPRSPAASSVFAGFGLCPLPSPETTQHVAALFLAGPNVIFPVLRKDSVLSLLSTAQSCGPAFFIQQAGYSSLLHVYLVLLLGSFSTGTPLENFDPAVCLNACMTLMGHALHEANLATVQAMLLLAMAQRCYNNVLDSWNAISLAVGVANSIGLTKRRQGPSASRISATEAERRLVWKATCIFEKILAFELGRPSATGSQLSGIHAVDYALMLIEDRPRHEVEAAKATEDLATTLDGAGQRCIALGRRAGRDDGPGLAANIHEKIKTTGEAVLSLMDWANNVPYALSPAADLMQDQRFQPFETFLSLQYHNAVILLTRNSLLISEEALHLSVDSISTGLPWESVVRSGPAIAANAARKVLQLVLRSADSKAPSILPCLSAPLLAVIALTIHVMSSATSRIANTDSNLLEAAADVIRETFRGCQGAAAMESLLRSLEMMRREAMLKTTRFGPQNSPDQSVPVQGIGPTRTPMASQSLEAPDTLDPEVSTTGDARDTANREWWSEMNEPLPAWPDLIGWDWSDLTGNLFESFLARGDNPEQN